MKRILLILVIAVIIGGLLYYYFTQDKKEGNDVIKVSGMIEATEVDVGFKVAGRIVSLSVQEGDWVENKKVLAKLDDEDLRNRFELAKATLNSAQAKLSKLLAGSRPEEIREAEAVLFQAKSDLENKQAHYERMKPLFERGVIPKDSLDNAEAGFKMAKANFQKATENYNLIKEGPRKEDIEDAKAQVEQARASLKLAETQLSYTVLHSPLSGVVLVKSGEVGEVVNPGTSILTLADLENVWLKAYIPETDLGKVKWGQEVIVTTDLKPKKEYKGKISFISSQAEFTPKSIQTEKERVTLVYRIKVDIPNPDRELKPGMPADGRILLTSSSVSLGKGDTK
ncbi:MAG: efflux RND transporter periplasmic adaptor subunit [Syntrophaceae bacterium]|nr:efflux RND transporter periplasmic adaptor subunit [Syntrophaceae bacterium]